ncbi:uncharacterized protein BJX67DRAFT_357928 [Aspergillus lucknowensis]|uniref:Uncharacterized protein n=1 Tax=Aspergillus lucknowensis TaxID=176173 RepID=A0ABR4LME7_9EURO
MTFLHAYSSISDRYDLTAAIVTVSIFRDHGNSLVGELSGRMYLVIFFFPFFVSVRLYKKLLSAVRMTSAARCRVGLTISPKNREGIFLDR